LGAFPKERSVHHCLGIQHRGFAGTHLIAVKVNSARTTMNAVVASMRAWSARHGLDMGNGLSVNRRR
jgi:hypothetical protein